MVASVWLVKPIIVHSFTLHEISLPSNHNYFIKKKFVAEDKILQTARLKIDSCQRSRYGWVFAVNGEKHEENSNLYLKYDVTMFAINFEN